ncbi:hypothetical protein LJR245_002016 [Rhizobium leguminosarum]
MSKHEINPNLDASTYENARAVDGMLATAIAAPAINMTGKRLLVESVGMFTKIIRPTPAKFSNGIGALTNGERNPRYVKDH